MKKFIIITDNLLFLNVLQDLHLNMTFNDV